MSFILWLAIFHHAKKADPRDKQVAEYYVTVRGAVSDAMKSYPEFMPESSSIFVRLRPWSAVPATWTW